MDEEKESQDFDQRITLGLNLEMVQPRTNKSNYALFTSDSDKKNNPMEEENISLNWETTWKTKGLSKLDYRLLGRMQENVYEKFVVDFEQAQMKSVDVVENVQSLVSKLKGNLYRNLLSDVENFQPEVGVTTFEQLKQELNKINQDVLVFSQKLQFQAWFSNQSFYFIFAIFLICFYRFFYRCLYRFFCRKLLK